jgi:hypothetical protein
MCLENQAERLTIQANLIDLAAHRGGAWRLSAGTTSFKSF